MRKGARKEFGSLQHLGRRAERWRDILVQRLADTEVKRCLERTVSVLGLVAGLKGSEEMLSATQDAAVVVRRHLELALSVQAAAVLALLSFNKLTSVIIKVFSEIAVHGFCPVKELDEEGAKGDEEFKSSEEETGLGQGEGAKDVSDQIDNEDMLDGAYQNPEDGQEIGRASCRERV